MTIFKYQSILQWYSGKFADERQSKHYPILQNFHNFTVKSVVERCAVFWYVMQLVTMKALYWMRLCPFGCLKLCATKQFQNSLKYHFICFRIHKWSNKIEWKRYESQLWRNWPRKLIYKQKISILGSFGGQRVSAMP